MDVDPVLARAVIPLAMIMSASPSPPDDRKAPPQRPEQGRLRELARTQSFTLGRPFHVRLAPDGSSALFLRASAQDPTADLYRYHVAQRKTERLLSAEQLLGGRVETLSAQEKAARERKRIKTSGFTEFQLSSSGRRLVLKLDGQLYLYDLASERWVKLDLPAGVILTPKLSPDGKQLAFVLDHDLAVIALPDALPASEALPLTPTRLTTDGSKEEPNGIAEFVAQEEMGRFDGFWWSSDSRKILFQRNDDRALERFTIANAARPEESASTFPYPRPGQQNVAVRLFIIGIEDKKRTEIDWDREAYPYVARVLWPSRGVPCLLAQARDQHAQVFLRIDPNSGKARPLFEERDDAWLNLHGTTPRFVSSGQSFLWATEESGSWRLEHKRLAENGLSIVERTLVLDEQAGFHSLVHIDEPRGLVWYLGGTDPTTLHLYRARLDAQGSPVRVTTEEGWHDAVFASNGKTAAVTHSSLDSLPETSIYSVDDLGVLKSPHRLPHDAESPEQTPKVELVPPEVAGGFHAAIIRPREFVPEQKYPVVVYVYGGPGTHLVRAQMSAWFIQQWIADHGFVVVTIDGRGTPRRGRDFERALQGRFHDVPLEDQVKGLTALADHYAELDLTRVGIYGWSFGGYMAALAALRRPDIFHAAVAGAPVVDWFYYDTHYTERYLGVPTSTQAKAYTQASLLSYAADLRRPLLLLHGIADDNVYFAHSLQLADALFRSGRPFELIPLVGLTHQVADPEVREALFTRIVDFLGQRLW